MMRLSMLKKVTDNEIARENIQEFIDKMNEDFEEIMGYSWGFDSELGEDGNELYTIFRIPSAGFSDKCVSIVVEGKIDDLIGFLPPYVEGLKVGVKAMAGAPERAARIFTRQYEKDLKAYREESGDE